MFLALSCFILSFSIIFSVYAPHNPSILCPVYNPPSCPWFLPFPLFVPSSQLNITALDWTQLSKKECVKYGGSLVGKSCKYVPDLALMSFILFFGTYTMTVTLKKFKFSRYFPTKVRPVKFLFPFPYQTPAKTDFHTGTFLSLTSTLLVSWTCPFLLKFFSTIAKSDWLYLV